MASSARMVSMLALSMTLTATLLLLGGLKGMVTWVGHPIMGCPLRMNWVGGRAGLDQSDFLREFLPIVFRLASVNAMAVPPRKAVMCPASAGPP